MKIKNYIKDFLLLNDGVAIPGFGGFISEYESATFDVKENVFLPPSKKLIFRPDFSYNDNSLAEFIAQHEKIEVKEAIESINNFVSDLKSGLNKKESIILEGIGSFILSPKNEIIFEQDKEFNLLGDSFGLKSVKTTTEVNKKEVVINKKIITSKKSIKKSLLIAFGIIAIVALLIGIWFYSPVFTDIKLFSNNFDNELNNEIENTTKSIEYLDSIAHADSLKATINKTIDGTTGKKEALFYTDKKNDTIPINPDFSKFYIIAGSFQSLNKAEAFCKELNKKGFSTEIIHSENNLYRISIASFTSEGTALKELYKLRTNQEITQVWILKTN